MNKEQQTNKKIIDSGNTYNCYQRKGGKGIVKGKGVRYMVMEDYLILGNGHTMKYTEQV